MPVKKEEQEEKKEEVEEEVLTSSVQNGAVSSMNWTTVDEKEKRKIEIARLNVKLRKLKQ